MTMMSMMIRRPPAAAPTMGSMRSSNIVFSWGVSGGGGAQTGSDSHKLHNMYMYCFKSRLGTLCAKLAIAHAVHHGGQIDERLGSWAINPKVAGSIPGCEK